MTRSSAAALRRARRMMRPAKLTKAAKSIQKTMTSLMIASSLVPLGALTAKTTKSRKKPLIKAGQSLGTVLQQLGTGPWQIPGARTDATGRMLSLRIPQGAQLLSRTHRSATGSRRFILYLPASHLARPKGLILMLHGCNQNPEDFALGTHMNAQAEKHGLAVAWPAQAGSDNAASCWNWFKPEDQQRGAGEPALLAALTRGLMREFGLDREKVYVAGLSAGGAMATILADVYPDVFSAAGIHSGLARGAARNVVSAMAAMRNGAATSAPPVDVVRAPGKATFGLVRRIVFQGQADTTVHPSNAALIIAAALEREPVANRIRRNNVRGRGYERSEFAGSDGAILIELWMIEGTGHAWSGGRAKGSYTDSKGPDASTLMMRFFLAPQG